MAEVIIAPWWAAVGVLGLVFGSASHIIHDLTGNGG